MANEGLSAQNHALVLRLLRVCAISPQMADVLVAWWSQANLLLDAARDEGLAAAPAPVGHGLAEEGRETVDVAEGRRLNEAHETLLNDDPLGRWIFLNFDALLDAAEHAATLQSSHDLALAEAERLRGLVYVPGLRRCAKCSLRLVTTNLFAETGQMSANNAPQPCPNGCGPMWPVTERDAGNDLCDQNDTLRSERDRAMAALREAGEGLEPFKAIADHYRHDQPDVFVPLQRSPFAGKDDWTVSISVGTLRNAAAVHAKIMELIDAEG